jgi:RimJ/RimL family protein N-acetyltransferase
MNLILTPPKPSDLQQFYSMMQDSGLQGQFLNFRNPSIERAQLILKESIRLSEGLQNEDFCFIKLDVLNSDEDSDHLLIGFISINLASDIEYANSGFKTLLNFGIIEPFRNQGLMTKALQLRFEWFLERGYNFVPAFIKGENVSSERVLKKVGFIKVVDEIYGSTYLKRMKMSIAEFNANFNAL